MGRIAASVATACWLTALAAGGAGGAGAQVVTGTITDESGAPVMGALVRLLDDQGEPRASVLSNAQGRYLLRAPRPGRYRLTGQRIGLATVTTEVLHLEAAGGYERSLELRPAPIALEGIVAFGEQRCDLRAGEGTALMALWEEARKAFDVVVHTRQEGVYRLRVRRYERELDPETEVVLTEEMSARSGFSSVSPFVALEPERLIEEGFVQAEQDGSVVFYLPDVDTLLSDIFHEAHCFRLLRGPDDATVGIAIEPVPRRDGLRGTLWLDRTSHEIRRLDYSLTHSVTRRRGMPPATGFIDFEGLPSGAWIVRRWSVRTPIMADRTTRHPGGTRSQRVLHRLREEGGEVTEVAAVGGITVGRSGTAELSGRVYDEEAGGPLGGAVVYLSGTTHAAVADDRGRFHLRDLPSGRYTLSFRHPSLTRYGVAPDSTVVEVVAGGAATADLVVPRDLRLMRLRARCDEVGPDDGWARSRDGGIVSGIVSDPITGEPAAAVEVDVAWERYGVDGPRVQEHRQGLTIRTEADGSFLACGVPLDRPIRLRAVGPGAAAVQAPVVRFDALDRPYTFVSLELPRRRR